MVKKAIVEKNVNIVVVHPEGMHNKSKRAIGSTLFKVRELEELSVSYLRIRQGSGQSGIDIKVFPALMRRRHVL